MEIRIEMIPKVKQCSIALIANIFVSLMVAAPAWAE
jgi:hypothetical protein